MVCAVYRDDAFSINANPDLDPQRRFLVIERHDIRTFATPAPATRLEVGGVAL